MKGTKILKGEVYIYVTIAKNDSIKDDLKYVDGYIDENTFQWETVAHIKEKELNDLINSYGCYVFVRKAKEEDGITLPYRVDVTDFSYIHFIFYHYVRSRHYACSVSSSSKESSSRL